MNKENRRVFFKKVGSGLFSFSSLGDMPFFSPVRSKITTTPIDMPVYFTTGFKISEVTRDAAVIWTRLCSQENPNPIRHQRREQVFRHPIEFDEEQPVTEMDGGVKGCKGMVRVKVFNKKEKRVSEWLEATIRVGLNQSAENKVERFAP